MRKIQIKYKPSTRLRRAISDDVTCNASPIAPPVKYFPSERNFTAYKISRRVSENISTELSSTAHNLIRVENKVSKDREHMSGALILNFKLQCHIGGVAIHRHRNAS